MGRTLPTVSRVPGKLANSGCLGFRVKSKDEEPGEIKEREIKDKPHSSRNLPQMEACYGAMRYGMVSMLISPEPGNRPVDGKSSARHIPRSSSPQLIHSRIHSVYPSITPILPDQNKNGQCLTPQWSLANLSYHCLMVTA